MSDNENESVEVSTDDELSKVREALRAANAEAASNRHKATELETRLAEASKTGDRFKSAYVSSKINSALSEQGASNPKIGRLLDMSKIDVDESGELIGLDEQLPGIKEEFPEFFDPKRRAPNIDGADKPVTKKVLSSAEKLIQQTL